MQMLSQSQKQTVWSEEEEPSADTQKQNLIRTENEPFKATWQKQKREINSKINNKLNRRKL